MKDSLDDAFFVDWGGLVQKDSLDDMLDVALS